jgi:threonine/homoserine/homoserine lactone efflux protein
MFIYLLEGLVFGFSAGFSPGPLQTLVITQSLRYGIREGVKVAIAPALTDLPIILLSLFVITRLGNYEQILGFLSLAGGCFLVYLAIESFISRGDAKDSLETAPNSLAKGAFVNFLNPHPYLFWFTVGGPILLRAWSITPFYAAIFLIFFYLAIIFSKVLVSILAGKSRNFIRGTAYLWIMRGLGLLLLVFALLLFKEGLQLLDVHIASLFQ